MREFMSLKAKWKKEKGRAPVLKKRGTHRQDHCERQNVWAEQTCMWSKSAVDDSVDNTLINTPQG